MMQTAPEQGQFMALLLQIIGAVNTIELGVYTGYSSLWTALALPTQGRIIACDINEEWTSMARRYWQEAGVAEKVDLRLAPAIETLEALLEAGKHGTFDFVFIDADKENYDAYYERSLELLRPGGLIAVDNVLWSGRVADPQARDDATLAIRAFNLKLRDDDRIKLSLSHCGWRNTGSEQEFETHVLK
jgi:caffeoyl-CoA O-methyltransferase